MQYPAGTRKTTQRKKINKRPLSTANRGMSLEDDINYTNEYYLARNKAIIHKKPTPIQIVNVHYPKRSAAVIKEAYFKQAATTDYNGIYREKYIDFEAKETKNKTSFPFNNIHTHQIEHLKNVLNHGAIAFFIIRFTTLNETYFLDAKLIIDNWEKQSSGGRRSLSYDTIKKNGHLIPFHFQARVDFLKVIDKLYFETEE